MTLRNECTSKACQSPWTHKHGEQCYISCTVCYPSKPKLKADPIEVLLICLIIFALFNLVGATGTLVTALTKPDGTYQKCVIPAEGSGKGFYCDPVEKEEYWPHRLDDLVDNPDGSQTWWVSHAR